MARVYRRGASVVRRLRSQKCDASQNERRPGVHPGGGRVAMTHLNLPGVPDYSERITVYAADRIVELVFPSPYLRHLPTRLTLRMPAAAGGLETREYRASYEEAFREELRAFHAAATGAGPVHTPIEQARRDIELLISGFGKATS